MEYRQGLALDQAIAEKVFGRKVELKEVLIFEEHCDHYVQKLQMLVDSGFEEFNDDDGNPIPYEIWEDLLPYSTDMNAATEVLCHLFAQGYTCSIIASLSAYNCSIAAPGEKLTFGRGELRGIVPEKGLPHVICAAALEAVSNEERA